MKKIIFAISGAIFVLNIIIAPMIFAQDYKGAAQTLGKDAPIKSINKIYEILAKIARYAYTAFFIVAVIFIIIAAFTFLTARGDPTAIASARKELVWAIVAIIIALLSVAMAQIIIDFIE
ncbi:hypothetical protein HZB06_01580 [Candidatus Wolfebacteria bacterium]|nr:hypothetical protein [Candidatus Wolfebacteria bacterium]